jgi:hypothetical protein|tara:strand:- start:463 stop:879 length:417 start_codon:yes stop_codon:yes gene_type:complete
MDKKTILEDRKLINENIEDNLNKKEIIIDKKISSYIEKIIENKFNKAIDEIIPLKKEKDNKMVYEYTINELYQNTMQYLIDVINDIADFISIDHKNDTNKEFRNKLFNIFLNENRKLYTGIILILLSLIIYFVDGVST